MNVQWDLQQGTQRLTAAGPVGRTPPLPATEILYYHPKYKVFICRPHEYAVQNWSHHLQHEHTVSLSDRRELAKQYFSHELASPSQVALPPPDGPPIAELGKPLPAFQCDEEACGFLSTNQDGIQKHYNKEHHWYHSKQDPSHWHPVHVQSFYYYCNKTVPFSA
jgi:hypothetical protein